MAVSREEFRKLPREKREELVAQKSQKQMSPEEFRKLPRKQREMLVAQKQALKKLETQDPNDPSFFDEVVMQSMVDVGEAFDKYTGAPTRAAIRAAQQGENPISAFQTQFGSDPKGAPTGKEIAAAAGLSEEPMGELPLVGEVSPAGAAGLAIDIVADPTLAGTPVRAVGKAAQAAGAIPLGAAQQAVKMGGELGVRAAEKAGAVGAKLGEALTGVPAEQIKTFATEMSEVNKIIATHGEDYASMADDVRAAYNTTIDDFRRTQSGQISKSLEGAPEGQIVDLSETVKELNDQASKINAKLYPEQLEEIQDVIDRIDSISPDGKMHISEAFQVKEFLQDQAKASYMRGGQIFSRGNKTARAAKQAAKKARKTINESSPEIADANNQLSKLHFIEERMAKNVLKEGGAPGSVMAIGSGAGGQNVKMIQQLEEMTGQPFLPQAQRAAAARTFASPPVLPMDPTGKSFTRMSIPAVAGLAFGQSAEMAAIGAALSSPITLKLAVQGGQIPASVIHTALGGTYKLTDSAINQAYKALTSDRAPAIIEEALRGARVMSVGEEQTIDLEDDVDHALYLHDLEQDDELSNIEKAKRRDMANKKRVGVLEPDPGAVEAPQLPERRPEMKDIADFLRKAK